jgi:hypothetical protein
VDLSVLKLAIVLFIPAVLWAWLFSIGAGTWEIARTIRVVALFGLILTGLGAVIVLVTLNVWAPMVAAGASHGLNLLAGLIIIVPLLLGWGVESLGILLTLAACLTGMGQTVRQRSQWFWTLLSLGLVPLTLSALAGLFRPSIALLPVSPHEQIIWLYFALPQVAAVLPMIAAIATVIYARKAVAAARTGAPPRPAPPMAAT